MSNKKEMKSNFISIASLRVTKQDTHTSTNIALQQIGCNLYGEYNKDSSYFYLHEGDYCVSPCRLDTVGCVDYIDCNHFANGDEDLAVKLFLELAQMTDTKISGSWTTFNERTILHKIVHEEEDIRRANYLLNTYGESGRATPLELAEAVMRGDVKL